MSYHAGAEVSSHSEPWHEVWASGQRRPVEWTRSLWLEDWAPAVKFARYEILYMLVLIWSVTLANLETPASNHGCIIELDCTTVSVLTHA